MKLILIFIVKSVSLPLQRLPTEWSLTMMGFKMLKGKMSLYKSV